MKIMLGLGNPGNKYQKARHNLGFLVVDELAKKLGGGVWKKSAKFQAEILKISPELLLVKPQTFMNNSGEAVKRLAGFYKLSPEDIVVVHDDLDLLIGKMKLQLGGGAAGHHGVESVIESLSSADFYRLRLGIGRSTVIPSDQYVLQDFLPEQQRAVEEMVKKGAWALQIFLEEGLTAAQNPFSLIDKHLADE